MRKFLLTFITLLSFSAFSQSVLDQKLDGTEKGKNLWQYIEELEQKQHVRFFFLPGWIDKITFEDSYEGQTLGYALDDLLRDSDINYIQPDDFTVVLVKDPSQALQRHSMINSALRQRKEILKLELGKAGNTKRNQKIVINGQVIDSKSKDPLVGATVQVSDIQMVTITNADGRYEVQVPAGEHVLNISYVNFEEKVIDLSAYENGEVSIVLEETPTLLEEVVVSDRAAREITTSRVGQIQISMREIKRAPALLGEVDLIKQIQILPGVTTAGEAASGFNVRGGGVDQNLILYDGIPVFNSSHAFGFFSSFNSEAIRDVTFYKSGIPSEFGGRISSVLDMRSKEGDYEKWQVNGGIGMISTNLLVGGPISKEKTSIVASLRTTYSDWLVNTIKTDYVNLENSTVRFYDGTLKLAHKVSDNTKLTLSGYTSKDQFRLQGDSSYRWDNLLGSVRLDHKISPRLDFSFIVGSGSYGYRVTDKSELNGFDLSYKITYPSVKADFLYQAGAHRVSFGVQSTQYKFDPGTLTPITTESNVKGVKLDRQYSMESGIYLGDAYTINEKYFLEGGVRFSFFNQLGPAGVNVYKAGEPVEKFNLIDTAHYNKGDVIKTYNGFEPRLSFRFNINSASSLKIGYNRMKQYLHLVSNTTAITPIDIWQPSNTFFKPQTADQLSIGYFKTFKEKTYESFVEVYYKTIDNILDFKDGANLILNKQLEADLLQGRGESYGAEFSAGKNTGRLNGSINYTYSRSFRQIKGPTDEQSVNKGSVYASNFDQPNIVNISWKYGITRRYFFTGFFTYHTGRPVTIPLSGALIENFTVANFSARNSYRIPDYHRLDLALVIEGSHKRKKFWDGIWTISVYNAYARKNAYSVFFKDDGYGFLRPYRLAIVGTVLPSISYSFKL